MTQDMRNYDDKYFTRDIPENWYSDLGLLRPDETAAVAYMYGLPFWGDDGLGKRQPDLVISIGCGKGFLEKKLEDIGLDVIGVDPSPGAKKLYMGKKLVDTIDDIKVIPNTATVLFVESVEHLPKDYTIHILGRMPVASRAIFVNWFSHHPLPAVSEWDHITEINDQFFEEISVGWDIRLRRLSHTVMDRKA